MGLVFAFIVILLVAAVAAIAVDAASLTATDSQTLSPDNASIGKALVVYNPAFSGSAKTAAEKIATALQTEGYTVDLAGVKSGTAADPSSYDIVIVGGPMYWGQATSSIDSYLKSAALSTQTKLGVYVTTGSSQFVQGDFDSLQQQVKTDTNNHPAALQMVLDGNQTQNTADLVSALTQ